MPHLQHHKARYQKIILLLQKLRHLSTSFKRPLKAVFNFIAVMTAFKLNKKKKEKEEKKKYLWNFRHSTCVCNRLCFVPGNEVRKSFFFVIFPIVTRKNFFRYAWIFSSYFFMPLKLSLEIYWKCLVWIKNQKINKSWCTRKCSQ